jgi:hypothetical protein
MFKTTLTTNLRNADFGTTYYELAATYPDWAIELHNYGNYLDNEKLEIIATKGIIHWYCKHELYNIDPSYPYFEKLNKFYLNPEKIEYYDWIKICKISNKFKINRKIFPSYSFYNPWKFNFLNECFPANRDYHQLIFGKILLIHYTEKEISNFILAILRKIKPLEFYFEKLTIINTFIENNDEIKKLGIIFQRLKVIVEKMEKLKHIDLYKFDMVCDEIQTYIYSWVKNYFDGFFNMKLPNPIKLRDLQLNSKYFYFLNKVNDEDIDNLSYSTLIL